MWLRQAAGGTSGRFSRPISKADAATVKQVVLNPTQSWYVENPLGSTGEAGTHNKTHNTLPRKEKAQQ